MVSGTVCILYHFISSGPIVEDVVSVFRPRIKLSGLVHSWPCGPPTRPSGTSDCILASHNPTWTWTQMESKLTPAIKMYKLQFFLYTKVIMKKVISERLMNKFWKEVGTFLFFFRTTKSKTSTKDNFTYLQ